MKNDCVIIIFSKIPVAGQVKTRLIPSIGKENANKLYIDLFENTMNVAQSSEISDIQLWCAPSSKGSFFERYNEHINISLYDQVGNNLGERMHFAIKTALKGYGSCILIGCDCPGLLSEDIEQAYRYLKNNNAVIGPANDGGYYLVATNSIDKALFNNIKWSSEHVIERTRRNMKKLGWQWKELRTLIDVDTPSDLGLLNDIEWFNQSHYLH